MTQYTRSVIPGRAQPDERPLDGGLDRMVFGRAQSDAGPGAEAPVRSSRKAEPMADDDAPPEHLFTERAPRDRRKSSPRRKIDYAALSEEAGNRTAEASKRGPLILIVTLIVIGVFGAVVWNAYSSGLRTPDGGPTPELASAGPFKLRPTADAAKPSDIDASVFERVARSKTTSGPATTLEARPEGSPEQPPQTKTEARLEPKIEASRPPLVKSEPSNHPAPKSDAASEAATSAPIKPAPTSPIVQAAAITASPPKAASIPPATLSPASAGPSKPAQAPTKPSPKPVAAAPVATIAPAEATAPAAPALEGRGFHPAFTTSGPYVVQLAAPSTEAAAQAEWGRRLKAAPALLGAAEKILIQADVNGKTVYRLRAGSFATSADADGFCAAIKASGGACFTAKK